ncbi:DNA primase [Sphaerimonospora thailandensis]|uniref:DNA primase n=1 Tax=Sphaerimonospora thailandensis TaxID=795644 RepID=A0A8J3VZG5_9ACTN|nr:DNA primase [Sphaerimonospora thailandensis]GIH71119.1 DNA primase [Sphaerimonospora thailandensis]
MAGRIRDEDIALVRERSPIADVVGEHIQLRNAGGGNLKGLCPFHDEKSPSFNVTPARGYYYCFGCAEGGDVITFVRKIESLTFTEAVERLAQRAGIQLRYEQGGYVPGREQGERLRLIEAHRAAAEFYAARLAAPDAAPGRRFLSERGFERVDAEHFGVGYAPAEWEALTRHLVARGFTPQELIKGGLAREGRRGPVDRFRGRLVWPIRDITGDVIGFGARKLLDSDDGPKYLNTPESPIYHKSSVLYGVDLAKREIARRSQAVIVEGYTDVMACHLAGVPTAVATCGTSFGEEHIKVLRRLLLDQAEFRGEVIFTFDGDSAGQKAALRAFQDEQKFVTQTFVAVQPDGLDPCDLRVEQGDAAVRDLIARREPLFAFAIRSVLAQYDLNTNEGRLGALDAAAPIVASIKDPGLRKTYVVDLDRWLGFMDERFVIQRIQQVAGRTAERTAGRYAGRSSGGTAGQTAAQARGGPEAGMREPDVRLEVEALKLAVQRPALLGPEFDALGPDTFTLPEHVALHGLIIAAGGTVAGGPGGREWVDHLLAHAASGSGAEADLAALVTRFAVEALRADVSVEERYGAAVLAKLQEIAVGRAVTQVKSRLQRLNPVEEQQEYNRLFGELVALEQQRRVLRDRAAGA